MARAQPAALDIREMSFQNVVDQILKPNGVKMGGFPDDMFLDLTEEEQSEFLCNICYMVLNEPRECDNKHLFCETCIFAWSMTYGENSQKCPVCRCDQKKYEPNRDVRKRLWDKKVRCPEEKCDYSASLRPFLMHSHGKDRFSNDHVNLEELRPPRPEGARLLVLPNIILQGGTRHERVASLRDQIHQGRMMIHQMMLLLHLEMQLRHQALVSYNQATDPVDRLQRLDEVMALNEQLNEVGGVLSTLLNSPINSILGASGAMQNRGSATEREGPAAARTSGLSDILRMGRERTDLSDSNSSTSSEESETMERFRMDFRASRVDGSTSEPRRRLNFSLDPPADDVIPDIPAGRHLSDHSQAGAPMTEIHPRVLLGASSNGSSGTRQSTTSTDRNSTIQETTRVLSTNNTRASNGNTSGSRSSTTALPSINTGNTTTVANSVARTNTENQYSRSRDVSSTAEGSGVTNGSATVAPQRLLSGRTRTQPLTLTTSRAESRTPITYQSSQNAGSSITPRPPAQTNPHRHPDIAAPRQGPSIGPALEFENPDDEFNITESTTPRFEQRNAFRVSQASSNSAQRANSATRRTSTTVPPPRDAAPRQPRYATRPRQQPSNTGRTGADTAPQRSTETRSSQSPERNNNRTGLNRPRDISNRLANASYRRSVPNAPESENANGANESEGAVPKPPARRRSVAQSNSTVPRGPGTSGQLLRARRRSEIAKELMKSRENGN